MLLSVAKRRQAKYNKLCGDAEMFLVVQVGAQESVLGKEGMEDMLWQRKKKK